MKLHVFRSTSGFSLMEAMVVAVIMGIVMMSSLITFQNQTRANNFLELQSKREQLRTALISQVLSKSVNCKCMFAGANAFPAAGIAKIVGFAQPTALGKYAASDCSGVPAIPEPLITTAGSDGVKLSSVEMIDVSLVGGSYGGNLLVNIESTKDVIGPKIVSMKIPVNIATVPAGGGNVSLSNCMATTDPGGGGYLPEIQMVKAVAGGKSASVQCPVDFTRIACTGSRHPDLRDTCDEDGCGFVGVAPIEPNGCKVSIDSGSGTRASVWATCIRTSGSTAPIAVDPAPDVNDGIVDGDPELTVGGDDLPQAPLPPGASCVFNGNTIPDGNSVNAYQVSSGASCPVEARTCNNGVLSGSYAFSTCTITTGGGGGGGGGCFVAGSLVTMADGSKKPIEDLKEGDEILSYDDVNERLYKTAIQVKFNHEPKSQLLHHFILADGRRFTSNAIHPIYVVEKARWFSSWQIYDLLALRGEKVSLLTEDGEPVRILRIDRERKFVPVYNLEVVGIPYADGKKRKFPTYGHTYFVNGILVHNAGGTVVKF